MTNNYEIQPADEHLKGVGHIDNVVDSNTLPSIDVNNPSWLKRNRLTLGIAGIAIAGALSITQFDKTVTDIEKAAHWAIPSLVVSESFAWGGAALMLLSAGNKIGNPFTVKKRLTDIASKLEDNSLLKKGFTLNVAGAAGTSAVIAAGALTSLPATSWPLAAGAATASLAFSALPLKGTINRSKTSPKEGL